MIKLIRVDQKVLLDQTSMLKNFWNKILILNLQMKNISLEKEVLPFPSNLIFNFNYIYKIIFLFSI